MFAGVSNTNPVVTQPVVPAPSATETAAQTAAPVTQPLAPAPAEQPVAPQSPATPNAPSSQGAAQTLENIPSPEQTYQNAWNEAVSQASQVDSTPAADLSEFSDRTDDPAFTALLNKASDPKSTQSEKDAANQDISKYIQEHAPAAPAATFVCEQQADKTQEQAQEKQESGAKKEAEKADHAEKLSVQDRKIQTLQTMRDRVYAKYSKLPPVSPLRKDLEAHLKEIDTAAASLNEEKTADKETWMRNYAKKFGTILKTPKGEPQALPGKMPAKTGKIVGDKLVMAEENPDQGLAAKAEAKPAPKVKAEAKPAGKKGVVKAETNGEGDIKKGKQEVAEKVVPPKEKDLEAAKKAVAAHVAPKTQAENVERRKVKEELTRAIAAVKGKMDCSGEAALTKGGELAARRVKEKFSRDTRDAFFDLEHGTTCLAGVVHCTPRLDGDMPVNAVEGQAASREDNDKAYNKVVKDRPNGFDTSVMHLWANWNPIDARTRAARAQAMHGNSAA